MNHFHRVIFNRSLGARQVVSEIASSGRGTGSTVSSTGVGTRLFQAPRLCALAAACLLAWYPAPQALAASCDAGTPAEYIACVTNAGTGDTVNLTDTIASDPTTNLVTFENKNLIINSGPYTLTVSRAANMGGNTLVFDGGTLHQIVDPPTNSIDTDRSIILNGGGGTLQADTLLQISTAITGTGGLTKTGTGALFLTGDNTYQGPTTISEGRLWVGRNSATGTLGAGDITTNAILVFSRSDTSTVANNISGTGMVQSTGVGTITLTGRNTYQGLTYIANGTLQVGNGGSTGTLGTGDVYLFNGSTLAFNRSDNITVANNIIHAGTDDKVEKQGAGILTLSGTNTYTGGTTITQGTLQVGDGATNGSIMGDVVNNGTLAFNRTDDVVFSGLISGSGGLRQDGTGTLTLGTTYSDNTYTGGTRIERGTISIARGGNLGRSTDSLYIGQSGKLQTTVNMGIENDTTINAGTISTNGNTTLNHSGVIGGVGGLIKTGAGTLLLSGANTYTQGTHVLEGTLSIFADEALGAVDPLNLGLDLVDLNGGTLRTTDAFTTARPINIGAGGGTLKTDANLSASGIIDGAGSLTKTGAGTLELLGDNSYSGATIITTGTLQVGNGGTTGSLGTGAVTNNAALVFNRSGTLTAANNISGTGTLEKQGSGNLILSGASTYTGATTVNAGTLSVNGSLTSATTVNSGGTLGGNGSVGNVNVVAGGTLAPGNSIGTLTVNGNLTFAPGSIYRVETDAAGNADRVNVVGAPGTLTINGGTVDVQAGAGNYARNTRYTILTSTGATTGTFTGVTSNLAFLRPSLSYLPNGVTLSLLAENTPSYNTVAQTPNQASVANYLNNFANTPGNAAASALIQQIDNLTAEQARTAFDSMSGSKHAAASQIAGALGRNFSATLTTRTGFGLGSTGTPASSTADLKAMKFASVSPALMTRHADVVNDSPVIARAPDAPSAAGGFEAQTVGGLWGQAMGTRGRTGSDGNGPESRYRANGFVFGYDQALSTEWLGGIALGYTRTQWDANTRSIAPAGGRTGTPQAGLYARYTTGPWQVRLDGTYSDHRFSTDRTVTIGNASYIARSSHGGTEWGFAAQAEYAIQHGDWEVRPLAGLRHARLSEDTFTETGAGAANLTVDARRSHNTVASLGVKLAKPLGDPGAKLQLSAIASHLMGDNDSPITSRLAGQAASFTAAGTPLKRSALTLGATLTGPLSRGLSAYADAAYEYRGAGQNAFMFTAGMRLSW